MDKAQQDALKKAAGIEAAKLIENGMIAGLGTGSTVRFLVDELGRRVKDPLYFRKSEDGYGRLLRKGCPACTDVLP